MGGSGPSFARLLSTCPCGTGTAHGPALTPPARIPGRSIWRSTWARRGRLIRPAGTATGQNSGDGLPHGRQSWEAPLLWISAIRSLTPRPRENGDGEKPVGCQSRWGARSTTPPDLPRPDPSARTRAMGSDSAAGGPAGGTEPHSAKALGSGLAPLLSNGPGCPHAAAATCMGIAAEGPEAHGRSSAGARSKQSPSHGWPCPGAPNGASSVILRPGPPGRRPTRTVRRVIAVVAAPCRRVAEARSRSSQRGCRGGWRQSCAHPGPKFKGLWISLPADAGVRAVSTKRRETENYARFPRPAL